MPPPTIIDLKSTFLRAQILQLSQPLRASAAALSTITEAENGVRQKAIDDALRKANALLKRHNRLVYGPQATRHVAEQIDRLYWGNNDGEGWMGSGAEEWCVRGAELRKDEIIEQMPEDWSEEAEKEAPEKARKYGELQRKLVEVSERRKVVKERLEQYRIAKQLLIPFEGEEAGLQSNLVVKNGEVEKELERMRMLMLRVERGLKGLEDRQGDEMDIDFIEDDGDEKLRNLFG